MNPEKQIDISNITKGLAIKNYKEMCELIGDEVKCGKAKILQIDNWKCYFDFTRQGQKFIITEIFPEPKQIIDKKIANSLYVKFIEILLMAELSNKDGYTAEYTKTNLFHLLGMSNSNYIPKNRYLTHDSIAEIPYWQKNHFYQRSNQKLTEILFSAFNSMKKRCLIDYTEQRKIVVGSHARVASDDEVKQILAIEKNVLDEMGYLQIPFMKINEFYELVNMRLKDEYGWDYVFKDYKIIYNSEYMDSDIQVVKKEISSLIKKNKIKLNENILQAIYNQAEYYYQKNCKEYKATYAKHLGQCWGEMWEIDCDERLKLPDFFNYPTNYIKNQNCLADLFLKINDKVKVVTIDQ